MSGTQSNIDHSAKSDIKIDHVQINNKEVEKKLDDLKKAIAENKPKEAVNLVNVSAPKHPRINLPPAGPTVNNPVTNIKADLKPIFWGMVAFSISYLLANSLPTILQLVNVLP